jgi:hypothetical protein
MWDCLFLLEIGEQIMIKKILFLLTIILQFSGVILASILENLSTKKMGVARYLLFKKQEFSSGYFSPRFMDMYTYIFVAGAAICILLLLLLWKRKKGIYALLFALFINIIGIQFIQMNPSLQADHFFLIGIFIVLMFQYARILYAFFSK